MSIRSSLYRLCREKQLPVSWRKATTTFEEALLVAEPEMDLEGFKRAARIQLLAAYNQLCALATELDAKAQRRTAGSVRKAIIVQLKTLGRSVPALLRKSMHDALAAARACLAVRSEQTNSNMPPKTKAAKPKVTKPRASKPKITKKLADEVETTGGLEIVNGLETVEEVCDKRCNAPEPLVKAPPEPRPDYAEDVPPGWPTRGDESTNDERGYGFDEDGEYVEHYAGMNSDGTIVEVMADTMLHASYLTNPTRGMIEARCQGEGATVDEMAKNLSRAIYLSRVNRSTMTIVFTRKGGQRTVDWRSIAPRLRDTKLSTILLEAITSSEPPMYADMRTSLLATVYVYGRIHDELIGGIVKNDFFTYLGLAEAGSYYEDEYRRTRREYGAFSEALARLGMSEDVVFMARGLKGLAACRELIDSQALPIRIVADAPTAESVAAARAQPSRATRLELITVSDPGKPTDKLLAFVGDVPFAVYQYFQEHTFHGPHYSLGSEAFIVRAPRD